MTTQRETLQLRPAVLRWARERADLTREELARKVKLKAERVSEWENSGEINMAWAERLAAATHSPLGFLFLSSLPDEPPPIADFRTRSGQTPPRVSLDLLETVQTMQRRSAWLRDELIENGAEPVKLVGAFRQGARSSVDAADAMRSALGLAYDWAAEARSWSDAISILQDQAEAAGVMVVFNGVVGNDTTRKLNPEEFQGFALVDEYAPLIFVNNADYKAAQMFTVAHELAHLFVGQEGISASVSLLPSDHEIEILCNRIAAEFLVPEAELRAFWTSVSSHEDRFQQTARHFKVSRVVAARRALDLELINREAFFRYYGQHKAQGARNAADSGGGNFWNTQRSRIGARFAAAVVRALKAGRLSHREAYSLTGLKGDAFENIPGKLTIPL